MDDEETIPSHVHNSIDSLERATDKRRVSRIPSLVSDARPSMKKATHEDVHLQEIESIEKILNEVEGKE